MTRIFKKTRTRGIVILTALFLVLVIFALITNTMLKIRFSQGLTKGQVQKTRAVYLSKAGLNLGLAKLNDGESLPGAGTPDVTIFGDDQIEVYQQAGPESNLFLVVCTAKTPYGTHTSKVVVRQEGGDFEGAVFARGPRGGSSTDALLIKRSGANNWENLEPPTRVEYTLDPSDPNGYTTTIDSGKEPENLQNLEATGDGQLFARFEIGGGKLDTLYRYDMASNSWDPLPPPPAFDYVSGSAAPVPAGPKNFANSLSDMSFNGEHTLYVRGKSATGTEDVIYRYDTEKNSWDTPLPRPGNFDLNPDGSASSTQNGFAAKLKHLANDGSGNLYVVQDRGGPLSDPLGSILKYNSGTGKWNSVAPPEKVTFDKDSFTPKPEVGFFADHINQMDVNEAGEIFARGVNDNGRPDTLYHFANGGWTVIPPPPQIDFHKTSHIDSKPAKDYSDLSVDSEGRVYLRENRGSGKYDAVYVYTEGEYSYLPRPNNSYYEGGAFQSDTSMREDIQDLTGGSNPIGGNTRYVPTAEF